MMRSAVSSSVLWSAGSYAVAPSAVWRDIGAAEPSLFGSPAADLASVDARLRAQRRDALAGEVLHPDPSVVAAVLFDDDGTRIRDGVSTYNRWIAEFVADAPNRLVGVGLIPPTGLDDAIAAIERCHDLGLPAVTLVQPPAGAGSSPVDGMEFWEAANQTVVCLPRNFGDPSSVPDSRPAVGAGRAPNTAGVLLRLAFSGVVDEVPGLRFLLVNQEAGWLPHALAGADTNYLRTASSRAVSLRDETALPSEYVRRVTWATFHADRFAVVHRDYFGEAHLLWSAALPSLHADWPRDEEGAAQVCEGLPAEATARLLSENCRRLFGIGEAAPFTPEETDDFQHPVFA
jgi:predicted TIM-barrel fold metal-dependent hydrolase